MKMVINQLEGILIELKDVAKELREVRFKVYTYGGFERSRVGGGGGGAGRCELLDTPAFNQLLFLLALRFQLRSQSDEISLLSHFL